MSLDVAVRDGSGWPMVCDAVARTLGGVGTALVPLDPANRGPWMVHSDSLSGLLATYIADGWHLRDLRQSAVPAMRARGYATDYDFADARTMRTHPYYAEFMKGQQIGAFVGIHIATPGGEFCAAVQRSMTADPPDHEDLRLVPTIREKLSQSTRAAIALSRLDLKNVGSSPWMSGRGVCLLRRDGKIKEANAEAKSLLSAFLVRGGVISLPDARNDRALQVLIARACSHDQSQALPQPVCMSVDGSVGLVFEAIHAPAELRHFHIDVVAVLLVRASKAETPDLRSRLAKGFGLSPAEIKVALGVAEGLTLRDISDRHKLAESTVRQQLKSVFRKTQTQSQLKLALLMGRL